MRRSNDGDGRRPSIMMVTGAYFPETSGAGLQCRSLIRACGARAHFAVLTTALDPALHAKDEVDGVPVRRVLVNARSRIARWLAMPWLIVSALDLERDADIIHLHGYSEKSIVVSLLAWLLRKPVILKLTSVGHDDPVAMRGKGRLLFESYRRADRFVAVSPRLASLYADAGLPPGKLQLIPNGVDLDRFYPAGQTERMRLRRDLGLPADEPLVLFVGFFSQEKCPDLLFDAWTDTLGASPASTLVIVGASRSDYYEIDGAMAARVRSDAARLGCQDRVRLVEHTASIELYYRAADIFVLPSKREGLPNALLEAMASGLPSIVSRLPEVTDSVITDGVNGVLVEPGSREALASALRVVLGDADCRARLGSEARRTVEERFSLAATADRYIHLYEELSLCAASPAQ
jgi:glycosyltransferase involved in cell wall biosynthesis